MHEISISPTGNPHSEREREILEVYYIWVW